MSRVLAIKTYLENNISELTSIISSSSLSSNLLTTYSKQLNAFIVFNQIFSLAYSDTYSTSDIQIIEYFQSISLFCRKLYTTYSRSKF